MPEGGWEATETKNEEPASEQVQAPSSIQPLLPEPPALVTPICKILLGWLLVMKKRVLQCDLCGAVVNAS
jgi:hypothetical protein